MTGPDDSPVSKAVQWNSRHTGMVRKWLVQSTFASRHGTKMVSELNSNRQGFEPGVTIATTAPTPCLHAKEQYSLCNLYSQLAIGAYGYQPSTQSGPGPHHLLPRNRALPVLPPRTHIPSTATAAAQMSYHETVSSGAVVSMVIVHPPPAVGGLFVSARCNCIKV